MVHFRSTVKLDFPASDIAQVTRKQDIPKRAQPKAPAEMSVNFLGLAGALGALDIPSTELVLQRESQKDTALKDFLDIFNHRLVSLLYRIRKHHRVGLGAATPGMDQVARYLYSLIGMQTPHLKGRMHVRDRALLYYAGILAQQPRSMAGLERILTDYFQVEVKTRQFVGQWCELEESQWTTIGESGTNQRLGRDTVVVGTQVWDQHARFEIQLGPLDLEDFESFLPTEWRFSVLCDLVRFYVKDEFEFNVRLILKAEQIPPVNSAWIRCSPGLRGLIQRTRTGMDIVQNLSRRSVYHHHSRRAATGQRITKEPALVSLAARKARAVAGIDEAARAEARSVDAAGPGGDVDVHHPAWRSAVIAPRRTRRTDHSLQPGRG